MSPHAARALPRLLLVLVALALFAAAPALAADDPVDVDAAVAQTSASGDPAAAADDADVPADVLSAIDDASALCDGTDDTPADPSADPSADVPVSRSLRQAADGTDDPGITDTTTDTTTDTSDCTDASADPNAEDAGSDVTVSAPATLTASRLLKRFSASYTLPSAGTVDARLVSAKGLPAGTKRHPRAVLKVLGTAHRTLARGGTATVTVTLTKAARAAIRALRKPVKAQLRTTIRLADGTVVKHVKTVTISAAKATAKG